MLLFVLELNVLLRVFSKRLIHVRLQSVVGQKRCRNSQQGCIANVLHRIMIHPSTIRGLLSRVSSKLMSIVLVLLSLQNAYSTISELQLNALSCNLQPSIKNWKFYQFSLLKEPICKLKLRYLQKEFSSVQLKMCAVLLSDVPGSHNICFFHVQNDDRIICV